MKPWIFVLVFLSFSVLAVQPDKKDLPRGLAEFEQGLRIEAGDPSAPPVDGIHSLGEWELADAAMTLWVNPSLVSEMAKRGPLKLLADTPSDESWWKNWVSGNGIASSGISYLIIPTDSLWIRDYGPWFIVDGEGRFGMVDTTYNRPRPTDDKMPLVLSQQTGIPRYDPGLVHTGGNYYNDGLGNAFSSTLVYTENGDLSKGTVNERMKDYLGIERYTTSRLAPGKTIEHIDTFGKLVAPDTWVFSEFPQGSPYRQDSETMVALLKTLRSPYGTPYKIHRLKMVGTGTSYRAYINSFISNRALYFPAYGDSVDDDVKAIYQRALPSYDIVPVKAMGTQWGDSVHCRTRNLLTEKTVFLFPRLAQKEGRVEVEAEIVPSPGAQIVRSPEVHWSLNGKDQPVAVLSPQGKFKFSGSLNGLSKGDVVKVWISAEDSLGRRKSAPIQAPAMTIDFTVE